MQFHLPAPVLFAIERLNAHGHEAFVVGGSVRDLLRSLAPHDFDITTSATPQAVMAAFSGHRVIETGLQHGTVTLLKDGMPLEITTYRTDGAYMDGRRPESVSFTASLREDLQRRDFTVNAMAYHPAHGLIDPFGGQEDLRQGLIRTVGLAEDRLYEDALRILRALRFAAQFDCRIEEKTARAMHALAPRLHLLSRERIREEMNKLLVAPRPDKVLWRYAPIFFILFPDLAPMKGCRQISMYHVDDVWRHTLKALSFSPPIPAVRWAVLLHDIGKPATVHIGEQGQTHFPHHQQKSTELAEKLLRSLKQPNALLRAVLPAVLHHDNRLTPKNVHAMLAALGEEAFFHLVHTQRADILAHAPFIAFRASVTDRAERAARRLLTQGACLSLKDLAVNGHDLMAAGFPKDATLGRALQSLFAAVLKHKVENQKEALLAYALSHRR